MVKLIGGRIPPKEHKKLQVEDAVDAVLDKLIFAKPIEARDVRKDCLFLPHQMGPMWMRVDDHDEAKFWSPEEVNHPQLVWPVGVGALWPKVDEAGFHTVECNYWQSVKPEVLRGRYRFVGRFNIAYYTGQFIEGLRFLSAVEYASWTAGRWRSSQRLRYDEALLRAVPDAGAAPIAPYLDKGEDDVGIRCAVGQSMALTYRYEWGAQFSIAGSARIIIPTTPDGVRELFNDRDKPEDRDRRAALRHWVRQHRRRSARGDFSAVREHLRGETRFSWRGFDVVIRPSQFDQERSAA